MPAEKTTGIILKIVEFSETSCVVTLYTRDFGKITALAKGARRLRSPFEGAIDLLAICRLVFLRKSVDKLDLLTEARLLRRFRSASADLPRYYSGLYVIELVSALTEHADPQPELFDLVVQAIETIDRCDDPCPLALRLLRFEIELLGLLGHQPSLQECVDCGKAFDPQSSAPARVSFGMLAGGVYCQACRPGKRGVVGLSIETWRLMKQLTDPQVDPRTIQSSAASRGELAGLLDQYLAELIGYRPKMQVWIKEAFRT
jgi:DNA repair protein RecO (recombination protein O)